MKKIRILLICALIATLACVIFAGCAKKEQITSIALKDKGPDTVVEFQIGKFDYSAHTVVVKYESGSVQEVALTEDMISELDRLKFYQAGDHTITVKYGEKTCQLKISVKRNTFGELKFPENNVFTYDGTEHKVELEGNIPPNATVTYVGGNSFVNAGSYDVTAVVTCSGYVTERVTTTVTVDRAKYDVSDLNLESKEVIYDGKEHSIEISGELPEGVNAPTYYINGNRISGAVDVGEYTVTASFSNNNPNYEPIPSMEAILKILPAEYDMGDVELIFKNESGSEFLFPWKEYDGEGVIFDIDNSYALKDKVKVSYTVLNEEGDAISYSNTDTNIKDAGIYTVKVDFSLLDTKNYKAIESKTYTFEVNKAGFDMTDLIFESKSLEYDGNIHSLDIVFPTDWDQTKFSVSYEYSYFGSNENEIIRENGEKVTGVSTVGEYTVRAVFTVNDPNYEQIPDVQAKLVISPKVISVSQYSFYNTNLIYTGDALKPGFSFDDAQNVSVGSMAIYKLDGDVYKEIDNAIDVGDYRISVTVSLVDPENFVFNNGEGVVEIVGDFTIQEAEIDISNLKFHDKNPSDVIVNGGANFLFDTAKVEGLEFDNAKFYRIEGDTLVQVSETVEMIFDNRSGLIVIRFDASGLYAGRYACVLVARPKDGNHVLSNGNENAEYNLEFNILG